MKKILVPTDFSSHSENALKVAVQIAKRNIDSEIVVVHMLEMPGNGDDALSTSHDIPELIFFKNAAVNKMNDLLDADYLNGINISSSIQFHKTLKGIVDSSNKFNVDLIVMGSHGASGFHEMFIGSNAEKVVRNSNIPVLIIKKEQEGFHADHFVFASEFHEESKAPFYKVLDFAKSFNSKLHLLHINTPNNFASTRTINKRIKDFLTDFDCNNYEIHQYNDNNVEKGVLHFAKDLNADLIGICTHGRKGLSHFLNGSISEDLVNHAKRPIITFKL
jgi:nucleotide-binding universal stress UspA family protein